MTPTMNHIHFGRQLIPVKMVIVADLQEGLYNTVSGSPDIDTL